MLMARLLFCILGLFALVALVDPSYAPNSFARDAVYVTSADTASTHSDDHQHPRSGSPDSCEASVGQHCGPLAMQLKNWAFTHPSEVSEPPFPGSDHQNSKISSEPATPPPRG